MALFNKKSKAGTDNVDMENQGESIGSKIVLAIVTLLIIVVWLAIIGLISKPNTISRSSNPLKKSSSARATATHITSCCKKKYQL